MRQVSYQAPFGFRLTPWVKRLLIANGVIFLLTLMVGREFAFRWFAFSPSDILTQPWGVVTYMFLHGDFWHLFVNMLVLFFFGPPLESRWGSREFIKFYFVCGLGGVALSFLFASYSIVGASAAVYGLMLAFAMNWPDAPIYIWGILPVKAKWLVAFLFVVSLFSAFGGAGGGIAHFAHLGGIVTGFLYLKSDWGPGRGRKPWTKEGGTKRGKGTKKGRGSRVRRLAIVPQEDRDDGPGSPSDDSTTWTSRDEALLDEVDRILDKISARGMSSLTPEERKILDEVSRKSRSN